MAETTYSFDFTVNEALLKDMTIANLNIVAVKPTEGGSTPTIWISIPIKEIAAGATVTVKWSQKYSVFFNATTIHGNATVTVENTQSTSLGEAGPSAWTYGPNPTAWKEVPEQHASDGRAQVQYFNNDNGTIGFAVETEVNGKKTNQPLGQNGVYSGVTVAFEPKEKVYLYLQNYREGASLNVEVFGEKFSFLANPNGLNNLEYSANHKFQPASS